MLFIPLFVVNRDGGVLNRLEFLQRVQYLFAAGKL